MSHTRVRCRAREWDVLAVGQVHHTTLWHLHRGEGAPRLIASPPDDVETLPVRTRVVSCRHVARQARRIAEETMPIWWPASAGRLPIEPLAWQYVPAMTILSGHHRRVLLADEVGMGKTVQAAILLHEIHARDPDASSLVVTPAGLVNQWLAELGARGGIDAVVLDAPALRHEAGQPQAMVDASRAGTCWLMSIDLLRQPEVSALVTRTAWTLLVVDEAHLASPATARLDAVSRVAAVSVRVLLITATPHAAGPVGAAALCLVGARPGEAAMPVVRRRASMLGRPETRIHTLRVDLGPTHLALCARLDRFVARARIERGPDGVLPALVLRRRATSCPVALVRSIERRLEVLGTRQSSDDRQPSLLEGLPVGDADAEDDERMREPAWRDEGEERTELRRLLDLARSLPPAGRKAAAVARLWRRSREPVVVFTAFVDSARAIRASLRDVSTVLVHGSMPDDVRQEALASFTGGGADVLVTTDASAEGLNLHARCRLVVHAEVPVSARVFDQRTGRVDRLGQARRVHALVLASDTEEEQSALARLRDRQDEAGSWVARAARTHCARTRLAERVMTRATLGGDPGDASPAVLNCRLPPRRWRRVARGAGWPTTTRAVQLGVLHLTGGPALATTLHAVAILEPSPGDGLPGPWPVDAWRRLLRGPIVRAEARQQRVRAWDHAARAACRASLAARAPDPGLFDEALARGPAMGPEPSVSGTLRIAFRLLGSLECRR